MFYLTLVVIAAFILIIGSFGELFNGDANFAITVLLSGIILIVILYFLGLLIETMLLSWSIITKNHFQELRLKGFYEDEDSHEASVINELNILKIAFEKNLLTEDEYEEKKKAVLERKF